MCSRSTGPRSIEGKSVSRFIDYVAPEHRPAGATPYVEEPGEIEPPERTQTAETQAVKCWPPVDEKTGKPLYFAG